MQTRSFLLAALVAGAVFLGCGIGARADEPLSAARLEALAAEVSAAELAFAKTLADRRLDRFEEFVAEDAVFRGNALRIGRAAVVTAWRPLFELPQPPFSWAPDVVTVAADGRSAISSGPVRDPQGHVASRFVSIWRKGADGRWRVAVDEGVGAQACTPAASGK
jgi:ketosteroid isomerase-like protein